jgi:hypothetical protein
MDKPMALPTKIRSALLIVLIGCGKSQSDAGSDAAVSPDGGALGSEPSSDDAGSSSPDETGAAVRSRPDGESGGLEGNPGASIDARAPDSSAGASEAGEPDAGSIACGSIDGGCDPSKVCVDQIFIGNPRMESDGAISPTMPSHSYSCVGKPCTSGSNSDCYCGLCLQGELCQVAQPVVSCTRLGVCAASDTPIATAAGERPIASLHAGDLVYSVDGNALRLVPLLEVTRTAVLHHHVIEVKLANGHVLRMSAGHPTADGRSFGDLRAGDRLDEVAILESREIAYDESYTYDLLPASETGTYVASGVLVGTTLRAAGRVLRPCGTAPGSVP